MSDKQKDMVTPESVAGVRIDELDEVDTLTDGMVELSQTDELVNSRLSKRYLLSRLVDSIDVVAQRAFVYSLLF